jgi:apolipoprotein N-acyltransferase
VPFDSLTARIAPPLQKAHRMVARLGWGHLATGLAGDRMTLFELPWRGAVLPFAVLICVENTYPPIPAEAGRLGARFFVNITSEGLVGGPIQEQLLRICILRAVENRMPYVRAGNTGISGFIDAEGRVRSVLRGRRGGTIDDAGVLVDELPLSPPGTTLYARSRDAFALACVAATLILFVWSFFRPRPVGA